MARKRKAAAAGISDAAGGAGAAAAPEPKRTARETGPQGDGPPFIQQALAHRSALTPERRAEHVSFMFADGKDEYGNETFRVITMCVDGRERVEHISANEQTKKFRIAARLPASRRAGHTLGRRSNSWAPAS